MPSHSLKLRIREFLTTELGKLNGERELAQSLRAMRAACPSKSLLRKLSAAAHLEPSRHS